MLLILPALVFTASFILIHYRRNAPRLEREDWRGSLILTSVLWGACLTIISEGLSVFGALSRSWLAIAWLALLAAMISAAWRIGGLRRAMEAARSWRFPFQGLELALAIGLAGIALALLVIAWVSPPNTVDALLYHLPRVAHWQQNQSLRHYPTGYQHQLLMPIWAETAILNLSLLWGNDRPANLVQWFSMVGSIIGVSGLAGLLGANRKGQWLAAAYAVSIPMGILQATSSQNDFVTAFWVVCLAYFVVLAKVRPLSLLEQACLGLALGLGMLTKGTFYVYATPLMIWHYLPRLFRRGRRRVVVEGFAVGLLALAINAGFWGRNLATYAGPLGPSEWLDENVWFRAPLRQLEAELNLLGTRSGGEAGEDGAPDRNTNSSPSVFAMVSLRLVAGVAKDITQNLTTPSTKLQEIVQDGVGSILSRVGEDGSNLAAVEYWNFEDSAGSPLHLLIFIVAFLLCLTRWRTWRAREMIGYPWVVLAAYAFLPLLVRQSTDLYGIRFQLPFFVLAAPVVGVEVSGSRGRMAGQWLSLALILASAPWVFFNRTRPLLGLQSATQIGSVLSASQERILFANSKAQRAPYQQVVEQIDALGCGQVGLRLDSGHIEYPFWWLFEARGRSARIETLYTYPELESLKDASFRPCAIICSICGDRGRLHGLDRSDTFGDLALYAGLGFVPDEDG